MVLVFFFNDTATTEIYTLSLHDALPICGLVEFRLYRAPKHERRLARSGAFLADELRRLRTKRIEAGCLLRSEEHTSELQSRQYLVCRLLLEKKNKYTLPVTDHLVNTL